MKNNGKFISLSYLNGNFIFWVDGVGFFGSEYCALRCHIKAKSIVNNPLNNLRIRNLITSRDTYR